MIEAIDLEKRQPFDQFTIAIVGAFKVGKSTLASTGREAVLFMDYDNRAESVSGRKGVYAIKLLDPPLPKNQTVIPATFDVITSLEKSKRLCDIVVEGNRIFEHASPEVIVKTLVLDSARSLAKASLNYILSSGDSSIRNTTNVGGLFTTYSPRTYVGWVTDMNMVEGIILRCFATGLDIILTLHESAEEAPDSTEENRKYTGRITVYPVRYADILSRFNEVWRVTLRQSGSGFYTPVVRVTQNWDFNSSTCMALDPTEDPDIKKMIQKHLEKTKNGQVSGKGV